MQSPRLFSLSGVRALRIMTPSKQLSSQRPSFVHTIQLDHVHRRLTTKASSPRSLTPDRRRFHDTNAVHTPDSMQSDASDREPQGRLEVIIGAGPMFSGKTSDLLRRIEMSERVGDNVLAVKSAIDTRHAATSNNHRSCIVTHSGAKKDCIAVGNLSKLQEVCPEAYKRADVIAIDEAQFFPDLIDFCRRAVDADRKTVYVAGLDGDFRREPFRISPDHPSAITTAIPLADAVTKHVAQCFYCRKPAPFTLRTVLNSREVLVGGLDSYVPVCRVHYLSKWNEIHSAGDDASSVDRLSDASPEPAGAGTG